MKRIYTIFLILFSFPLFFLLNSCESEDDKLIQIRLEKAINIAEYYPDEAFGILDSVQSLKKIDEKSFMLSQIAEVKARQNASLEIDSNKIDLITKATQYFEKQSDLKNTALANYYTGIAYKSKNNQGQSFAYFLRTYPYAEALNDSAMMGKVLYNIAGVYFDQQLYDSSIIYFKKAMPLLKNDQEYKLQAYRLIGANYYQLKDYKNALKYLSQGSNLLDNYNHKEYIYLYNTLYGLIFKDLKKYDKAITYFRNNLAEKAPILEQFRAALNLTDVYTLTNNTNLATYYVQNIVIPYFPELKIKNSDDNFLQLFGYRVLQDYYIELGDKAKIKEYVDLYLHKQLEVSALKDARELFYVDKKINYQRAQSNKENTDIHLMFYTFLISVLVLIIVTLFFFLLLRSKKEQKKTQNQKRLEKVNLAHKYEILR